jgi:hypothetical protein
MRNPCTKTGARQNVDCGESSDQHAVTIVSCGMDAGKARLEEAGLKLRAKMPRVGCAHRAFNGQLQ